MNDTTSRRDFILAASLAGVVASTSEAFAAETPSLKPDCEKTGDYYRPPVRFGLGGVAVVFIHDLSPDNGDMKDKWTDFFDIAAKGAMPELTRMRDEGLIKDWDFGVNTIEPILKALEVAHPDIFPAATQCSLMRHENSVNRLFPACEKHGVSIVVPTISRSAAPSMTTSTAIPISNAAGRIASNSIPLKSRGC